MKQTVSLNPRHLCAGLALGVAIVGVRAMTLTDRVWAGGFIPTYEQCEAQGNKITICHATSSETNPYVEETIACEALYGRNGNAGHFDENGTTQAGHEDDYVLQEGESCASGTETPTPTPTPTVEDPGAPIPTPVVTVGKDNPTPTPGSNNSSRVVMGNQSSLATDNCNCNENNTFDAVVDLKKDDQPVKGVVVHFTYHNQTVSAWTMDGGRAKATFTRQGDSPVTATAEGYPSQSMSVVLAKNCPQTNEPKQTHSPQVLGLASTGTTDETIAWSLLTLGVIGTATIVSTHAYKTKNC